MFHLRHEIRMFAAEGACEDEAGSPGGRTEQSPVIVRKLEGPVRIGGHLPARNLGVAQVADVGRIPDRMPRTLLELRLFAGSVQPGNGFFFGCRQLVDEDHVDRFLDRTPLDRFAKPMRDTALVIYHPQTNLRQRFDLHAVGRTGRRIEIEALRPYTQGKGERQGRESDGESPYSMGLHGILLYTKNNTNTPATAAKAPRTSLTLIRSLYIMA